MFAYLIDGDHRVLMQVSGPIKPSPGQRIVLSESLIPPKLASYDPEQGKIVRAPASQFAKVKRDVRQRKKTAEAKADALCAELELLVKDDPKLRRALQIVSMLPAVRVRRALASASEDGA